MKQENPCLRSRAQVRSLADLAGSFILSFSVRVRCNLREEYDEYQCKSKSQHPSQGLPRL